MLFEVEEVEMECVWRFCFGCDNEFDDEYGYGGYYYLYDEERGGEG